MQATTYRDDAPGPGSTAWYATGLGWRQAGGGTLASGWIAGDPSGAGAPSTAATEQVRPPASPSQKIKNDPTRTIDPSPPDIPAYSMAVEPLRLAQEALEPQQGAHLATSIVDPRTQRTETIAQAVAQRAQERARDAASLAATEGKVRRINKQLFWLEYALANPPREGSAYQVQVGPDPDSGKSVAVHIQTAAVQCQIWSVMEALIRERDALLRRD